MKTFKLIDHKPFAEAKAKYDGLKEKISAINGDETPGETRARAIAAEVKAMGLEAAAMLDEKLTNQAEAAIQEAKELKTQAEEKERRIRVIETALQQLKPELEAAKSEAAIKVMKTVRPVHEKLVPKILDAMRQLTALLEEEADLCNQLNREVGGYHCITPIVIMTADSKGKLRPGREHIPGVSDHNLWDNEFNRVIRRLRENNYKV